MRIAVVGSGRGVYPLDWAATLARRGHEVRFVTLGEVLAAPGVDVRTRPIPRDLLQAVQAARGFVRDIRSFHPDVLHLNYAGGRLGTLATLAGVHPLVAAVVQIIIAVCVIVLIWELALVLLFWLYALGMPIRYLWARTLHRAASPPLASSP